MTAAFPDNPCLVAVMGDWHGHAAWAELMVEHARAHHADYILHVGDFGIGLPREDDFVPRLHAALESADLCLGFVDGNHDSVPTLETYPLDERGLRPLTDRITHLPRGFRWQWWDNTWLALGGAHSINSHLLTPGYDWWEQETITWAQAENAIAGGHADVMVTHDVPDNTLGRMPGNMFPEYQIRASEEHHRMLGAVVDEVAPSWLFHGHMHLRHDAERELSNGQRTHVVGVDCNGSSWRKNMVLFDPLLLETRPLNSLPL